MRIRVLFAPLAFVATFAVQAAPAEAASAVQSTNCPSGLCAQFAAEDAIPVIKSYSFTMPGAGSAAITFNGSLFCASTVIADKVIDLVSAIGTTSSGSIPATTPSYLRHAHVLKDDADHSFDSSTSFNLASTRVINYSSGGSKQVYFRIARLRQDDGTTCYVNGGSFSVIVTP